MGFDLKIFNDASLEPSYVEWLVEQRWPQAAQYFGRLWDYYTNPLTETDRSSESSRGYMQAQETGLPLRITGQPAREGGQIQRKEVVIENDIGWRINAMVDFLFGRPVSIKSKAAAAHRRRDIEGVLKAVFDGSGGTVFFQELGTLGSVYGFVDCIVRWGGQLAGRLADSTSNRLLCVPPSSYDSVLRLAGDVSLELIDAARALPVLEETDYKRIRYYVQHFVQWKNAAAGESSFLGRLLGTGALGQRRCAAVTEILGPSAWQRYEDGILTAQGVHPLGRIPVVHIQNLPQPGCYEGLSDVQQLCPLQDELNTRLSDRASRITMQAFKMYLAKGLDGIAERPIAPGRMWCTDNMDAAIEEFGGDGGNPSENQHIQEVREAMDKVSGVTPVVAGVLKNKLGNLSSAVALKMTFMGMLSKTCRKQLTYGQGISDICRLVLEVLDKAAVFPTRPAERQVEVVFSSPLDEQINR
ncbi:MAG TPA: phage portal protein [Anaerohalosphaeraceae bacterium]|nr:phage portal protein [Anaerohalosphaeraceae bacterium]HOL31393.1 phage portal protein [Anaerohalosphaeraceae bacterium]HOM76601.1 phage portal protein [Anaerohalosphaeraceae bacterium]HPC64026.1 phage portal protein [Anaerohalosphaeraceae bacterium]HPO70314.1 phage portal protein [Anaerohalosphaeraceae bacterium]